MPYLAESVFVGFGVLLMLALSQPVELRRGRWTKVVFSLPVLLFIQSMFAMNIMIFCIGGVVVFTLIWMRNFTWFSAQAFHRLIHGGPGKGGGGFVPDYRAARSRVDDGDYVQAIDYVKFELAKEPGNFEGLWLLAAIYQELKKPQEAQQQIALVLDCPTSTPEQIATARAAQHSLRLLQIQLDSERERK